MNHRDTNLCLQESSFPAPLWALFRGDHFLRAYTHPEPARLASLRYREEGRVVPYLVAEDFRSRMKLEAVQ